MQILDGQKLSQKILETLKTDIKKKQTSAQSPAGGQTNIKLDIILVGSDPASKKYVEMKQKNAKQIGIKTQVHQINPTNKHVILSEVEGSSEANLIKLIKKLNQDPSITAIMVQLPLPKYLNRLEILNSINPNKDADGLTATNLGLLFQQDTTAIIPATALGIIKLLKNYKISLSGKNAVIIGRSLEVGLPLLALLNAENCTCTLCHSHTKNLIQICQKADILISAVGKPNFITADYVKNNTVVIDVGTNKDPQTSKLIGDVDFKSVADKCSFITPVPGGIGPMTIAMLLSNVFKIWQNSNLSSRGTK
ncbi:bifunctional 5,10-methylenetetrahydrofolate dehydrogenase/5,10-methenyltetrahydrofolate cyclohydrolase [Patescibacteria group bacterium]|nr:bifunctional 5,10-methylenetetrahydrofolate dehydrogenase/5,10-methenyltetrahydrofolate cyclohydrolase [Patescibacteria group bacterium]